MKLQDWVLIGTCLVVMVTDGKWHCIPNWLTFPAVGLGFLTNGLLDGWSGFGLAVGGMVLALLIALPLFALDILKAGDVKLLAAWGAIKGAVQPITYSFVLWAFLYGALVGGAMALVLLVRAKAVGIIGQRLRAWYLSFPWLPVGTMRPLPEAKPLQTPMPYGVALSIGALLAWLLEWWSGSPCPFVGY